MQNDRGIKKDPSTGDRRNHAVQHIQSLLFAERSLIQHTCLICMIASKETAFRNITTWNWACDSHGKLIPFPFLNGTIELHPNDALRRTSYAANILIAWLPCQQNLFGWLYAPNMANNWMYFRQETVFSEFIICNTNAVQVVNSMHRPLFVSRCIYPSVLVKLCRLDRPYYSNCECGWWLASAHVSRFVS